MTNINAEGHEVVRIEEVVRDSLSQVEGKLDELEGRSGVRGGEDDPSWVIHHRYICCQYHLSIKTDITCKVGKKATCMSEEKYSFTF